MLPLTLYQGIESAWCPGCGNFGMLQAFKQALAELEIRARGDRHRLGYRPVGEIPPLSQVQHD